MNYYFSILPLLGSALCLGLSVLTIIRNPRLPVNIGFAAGAISLALIEAGGAVVSLSSGSFGTFTGIRITVIGQALLPVTWFFFSIVFARADYRDALRRWAAALALFTGASFFFILRSGSPDFIRPSPSGHAGVLSWGEPLFAIGGLGRYFYIYLILGLTLSLAHLESTLRSSTGRKRWQIKYLIFGVGAALGYFIYLASEALLISSLGFEIVPLTASVVIISTSLMAVAIVRHRLLDVDIFISRHVVYNSVAILVVGLYLLAAGVISQGIKFFNLPFNFFLTSLFVFVSVLVLVVFFFTATLRRKAQLFINRNFYKHKYEFRDKWMETIEKISSKRSIEEISLTLKDMITETMGAKHVYLWLYDYVSGSFVAEDGAVPLGLKKIPLKHPFSGCLRDNLTPFTPDNPRSADVKAVFDAAGAALCAPLVAATEIVGFVFLGADLTGEPYIQDDCELLRAVTTQAAVQIRNITLAQDLVSAKEVEAFSKMSYFIMHDLKNLTNSLSLISQNASHNMDNPEFQRDAIKTIDGTVARMKGLIERLSNASREDELKKKVTTVTAVIDNALNKTVFPETKPVVITVEGGESPPVEIDPEAVEMVILNLVINAYDAIDKNGRIRIEAYSDGEYVTIAVSDDGCGMTREYMESDLFKPFKTTKKKGFGIGLYQCKCIIEAHGGNIDVKSQAGKGTTFTVKLPVLKEPGKSVTPFGARLDRAH